MHFFAAHVGTSCLCIVATFAVAADNLSTRIAEAKAKSATASGAKYDQSLGPFISEAMRSCMPPGSTAPENLGSFTLVAVVNSDGKQSRVEVNPNSKVSACFKSKFTAFTLLPPPSSAGSGEDAGGYPIAVEMKVTP